MLTSAWAAEPPERVLFPDDEEALMRLLLLQRVVKATQERRRLLQDREAERKRFLKAELEAFENLPQDDDDDDDDYGEDEGQKEGDNEVEAPEQGEVAELPPKEEDDDEAYPEGEADGRSAVEAEEEEARQALLLGEAAPSWEDELVHPEAQSRESLTQREQQDRKELMEFFSLDRPEPAESEEAHDGDHSRLVTPSPSRSATDDASGRESAVQAPVSVVVCPPYAGTELMADPLFVDSAESMNRCEATFRELLTSAEEREHTDLTYDAFIEGLLQHLIEEETGNRALLEDEECTEVTGLREHAPPLVRSSRESFASCATSLVGGHDKGSSARVSEDSQEEASSSSPSSPGEDREDAPQPPPAKTAAEPLPQKKRMSVFISPPNAAADEAPFLAFSLEAIESFEATYREHFEDQQQSSLKWLQKSFTETAVFIVEKQETNTRDFIGYDAALEYQRLLMEERHSRLDAERRVLERELRLAELARTPLVLTPAMAAKLEKMLRKEKAARNKIVKAEVSYLHAFHDEFAADLRRSNSFSMASMATMKLSMANLSTGAERQSQGEGDEKKLGNPFAASGRLSMASNASQASESFQRGLSAASLRRGDRKAVFTDELHTPRDLELHASSSANLACTKEGGAKDCSTLSLGSANKVGAAVSEAGDDTDSAKDEESTSSSDGGAVRSTTRHPNMSKAVDEAPSVAGEEKGNLHISLVSVGQAEAPVESAHQSYNTSQQYCPMLLPPKPIISQSSLPPYNASLSSMGCATIQHGESASRGECEGAAMTMKQLLYEEYNLHEKKHYRLRLHDFMDAVLITGMTTTMEELPSSRAKAKDGAGADAAAGAGVPPVKLWTHPLLFAKMNDYLAGRRYGVDGTPLEKTELMYGAWVYLTDCCTALVDGLAAAYGALMTEQEGTTTHHAAGVTAPAPPEQQQQQQLKNQALHRPAKADRAAELLVYGWTAQFITYGLQRLVQSRGVPNRDVAASVFDLLASATADIVANANSCKTTSNSLLSQQLSADGVDAEKSLSLTWGCLLPFKLFKNVFVNQMGGGAANMDALRKRTNIDYGGATMVELGVPFLAFSAFLCSTGERRNSFSLSLLRRTIEPILQPNDVVSMISPLQGKKFKKSALREAHLPLPTIKMLFVLRGADCIAKVANAHKNLLELQRQCRTSLNPFICPSSPEAVDKRRWGNSTSLPLDLSHEMMSPSDNASFGGGGGGGGEAGKGPRGAHGGRGSVAAGGDQRRAFMHSIRAYFYGILEHASDINKHKLAAKCLLLLVLFSTWMEQDEEVNAQGNADDDKGKSCSSVDRFWTRRIFEAAAQYYTVVGKISAEELNPSFVPGNNKALEVDEEEEEKQAARKTTLSPSDMNMDDFDAPGEAASVKQSLTGTCAKIAVLFYDFLLNLRGHRKIDFMSFMERKPFPTQEAITDFQQDIHYYYKQREGDDTDVGAASSKAIVVNGNDHEIEATAAAEWKSAGKSTTDDSVYKVFRDELEDEGGKWIRTPMNADVNYDRYPEGPESLKRVTEMLSRCLNIVWLNYSAELDGVLTFYSFNCFMDDAVLDLSAFSKTESDTEEMERLLEEAMFHAKNFNELMDGCMTYLQALWSGSRWMRTVASSVFDNPMFAVPLLPAAEQSGAALTTRKAKSVRDPYPKDFDCCAKQLAECIISVWPYARKARSPFHHIPDAVYRRKDHHHSAENDGAYRGNTETKTSSRSPQMGTKRRASLASFASSIRSFNVNAGGDLGAAGGVRSRCSSLTQRSFASLFDDIIMLDNDTSMADGNTSAPMIPGSRCRDPSCTESCLPDRPVSKAQRRQQLDSSRTQTSLASFPRRSSGLNGDEVSPSSPDGAATPAHDSPPAERFTASRHYEKSEQQSERRRQRISVFLAPEEHPVDPTPQGSNSTRRRKLKSARAPQLGCRAEFGSSRTLCAAPQPQVRECIELQSTAFGTATSRRSTIEESSADPLESTNSQDNEGEQQGSPTVKPNARGQQQQQPPTSMRTAPTNRRLKANTMSKQRPGGSGQVELSTAGKKAPRKPVVCRRIHDTYNDLSDAVDLSIYEA